MQADSVSAIISYGKQEKADLRPRKSPGPEKPSIRRLPSLELIETFTFPACMTLDGCSPSLMRTVMAGKQRRRVLDCGRVDIERQFPDHPGTQYLREIQNLEDGRIGRALRGFKRLLESFRNRLQFAFGLSAPAVLWVTPPYCARHLVRVLPAGSASDEDNNKPTPTRYFYHFII